MPPDEQKEVAPSRKGERDLCPRGVVHSPPSCSWWLLSLDGMSNHGSDTLPGMLPVHAHKLSAVLPPGE
jgi:hypothetical protein